MSTYVLVHGAWHGAWCWQRIVPLLEAHGHTVFAPDLPGSGEDETPLREVTLRSCNDRIVDVLDRAAERVVLVGHSFGGMVISQVAESRPDQIKVLVYVCAFLLRNGQSRRDAPADPESLMGPRAISRSEDRTYTTLRQEKLQPLFYNDCAEEELVEMRRRVGRQAVTPPETPLVLTEANFGRVPRVYIHALGDRGITPKMQRQMVAALPCDKVFSMDTSHSPFWSAPAELAGHLLSLA